MPQLSFVSVLLVVFALANCTMPEAGPEEGERVSAQDLAVNLDAGVRSVADLDAFVLDLDKAGQSGLDALEVLMVPFDSRFGRGSRETMCDASIAFHSVRVLRGQLDQDPELEALLQIVLVSTSPGRDRCEQHWIGVFDLHEGRMVLRERLEESLLRCSFDPVDQGVTLGWVTASSNRPASFWIQSQEADRCGTRVSYTYRRRMYQSTQTGLVARDVQADPRLSYQQTEL
jgi:hypothetical protein